MQFLIQFRRIRRGIPEVVRTIPLAAADRAAALTRARNLIGSRFWPPRTDSLRVMDDGGRTLIDWTVPVTTPEVAELMEYSGGDLEADKVMQAASDNLA